MPALSNPKHELFAQGLAKGKSQAQAYTDAGYGGDETAACRLARNVKVLARSTELLERAAVRTEITVADIARQLDEDRAFARDLSQAAAAISATMGKAKVLGLITDKVDLNAKHGLSEDLAEWLNQRG